METLLLIGLLLAALLFFAASLARPEPRVIYIETAPQRGIGCLPLLIVFGLLVMIFVEIS